MDNAGRLDTLVVMDAVRPPSPRDTGEHDNVVVLHGVPWAHYQALLRSRGEAPRPKLAFLDGELEIMTTSMRHEIAKKLIARLVETFAEERDVQLTGAGNTTFRRKAKLAGLEPDECYFVGRIRRSPHLAIEIVHTSGGIDKLEIYRRLGVAEVWFWIEGRFWLYGLTRTGYRELDASAVMPGIELERIARIVVTTEDDQQTAVVRAYRRSLRG